MGGVVAIGCFFARAFSNHLKLCAKRSFQGEKLHSIFFLLQKKQ